MTLHYTRWAQNCVDSLTAIGSNGGYNNPRYMKALRSALRIARDFNHDVYVLYDQTTQTYKQYSKMPTGNFDVCQPDGTIIH